MRKLASIQKIIDIVPIEGADKIELATILGWHVVVEKGKYKIGGNVIYCEVDSLLPLKPEFAFLDKGSKPKKIHIDGKEVSGHRIKTIKLRGQISQGIVFPITLLPDGYESHDNLEGNDVTKILGVHKYEMPLPTELAGKARGGWLGYVPKTDEPRLQAYPQLLKKYSDIPFYVTEKIDGSSVTFVIKNDEFHALGRTIDWLDDGKNTIWRVAKELNIESKMRANGLQDRVALQGEIYGPNIQGNPLKQNQVHIRIYNGYDFAKGKYIGYYELRQILKDCGIAMVPVIDEDFRLLSTVDDMVEYATRNSLVNPEVKLEGIVLRPKEEHRDPDLGRVSFKVISPEYLLKNEE